MTIKSHDAFDYSTPDEIAECWDGVDAVPGLYAALWGCLDHLRPISEQIDIEDSSPSDAVGLNTTASVWQHLSPEHQTALNALAVERDAAWERERAASASYFAPGEG